MKTNISKSKLTRAGAIILAVITLLSTIFIIPASASTGDPATITFDYAYDTGGNIITYHGTVTHDDITVGTPGEELCRIYADGKDAYCIQPGYSLYSGNTLIEGQSSVWNGVSKDKQKAVNIALLYGKPGNSKNLGYTEGQQWIATQVIVWEILTGCRSTSAGFKCTNTKFIDALTAGDHNPGVKAVYNTIANAMANHHTVPSFASNLASTAPTHTMQYGNGVYSVTLTDSNNVLSKFAYKTSGNIAVSISGNKMTLATNSPIAEEKTLAINKTVPTVSGNSVLVAFGDSYKQDVIVGLAAPDPVPSVFKLKTSGGHLKIVKTAEDGNIANIEFTVTGDNYKQTVKTNDKGELILAGLVPGTYTVTETPSDKYVAQPAQTVTVENGKTAEVKFNNTLNKGNLNIIKTSDDCVVEGIEFTVAGENYSKTVKTDKDGKINLTGLKPGTYTVTEAKSDSYVEQAPQTVTVETGKTATVKFNNTLKKGTITITKTGDIFASVTEEEVTEPTEATKPTEETTVPEVPTTPEAPTTPEVPTAPNAPSSPSGNPITPTAPAEPTAPTEPTKSTEPVEPDDRKPVIKYQPFYKSGALEGAEFTVTAAEDITTPDGSVQYKKGEVVDTITTGKNGKATSKELYAGKYTVTESKSPYGYLSNGKAITVEITYGGQNVEVSNTDLKVENIRQKAEITLQKVLEKYDLLGIGDNGEITNVAFALFADEDITAADGKAIPKDGLIEIISCDENGKVQFNTEIPFGKYYVQEYSTDKHYIIDDNKYPFEFAYTTDTDVQHFDITSDKELMNELKRGTVYTTKVDEEYPDNKLTGAKFEIYADIDGDKQFNSEVDKLVGEMKEVPVKIGDYYFHDLPVGGFFLYEKKAPEGFEKDDNYYYFEISEDGDEVTVENKAGIGFVNKPTTGELEITKKDVATGKLLPKAGFRIKDADGNVVADGYTDENGIAKFKLRAGKYTYEEFDAPEGYIIDTTPHEFEITEDGQIVKAEMTNEKETPPTTPQTGDSSTSGFFIGLGALALGGIAACVILFFKKKKDDGDDE